MGQWLELGMEEKLGRETMRFRFRDPAVVEAKAQLNAYALCSHASLALYDLSLATGLKFTVT